MANRPSTALVWKNRVQVRVSEDTNDHLRWLSREANTTLSSMCRIILQQALESEDAHKAEWLEGVQQEARMLERESAMAKGKKPKQNSETSS